MNIYHNSDLSLLLLLFFASLTSFPVAINHWYILIILFQMVRIIEFVKSNARVYI